MTPSTRNYPRLIAAGLLLASPLFVAGCAAVGPDYVEPAATLPSGWNTELTKGLASTPLDLQTWWLHFEDPVLSGLIERAGRNSLDLRTALARIDEARAQLGVTRGSSQPRVDADGSYARSRQSAESSLGGATLGDLVSVSDVDTYKLGVGAGWELDLFGRVRRSVEAAHAGWQASVEDYGSVLVVLRAEVALTYIEVRALQGRIEIAQRNILAQRSSREIVRKRREAGSAPGLDLAQAEANLASTEAQLPLLQMRLQLVMNRLSVLLGEFPGALKDELGSPMPIPSVPASILVGVPADLLRQRPDIRRAERLLAAQTARVGVATSDLYPRLSLGGFFGFSAQDPGDLLQSSSRTFSLGPSLGWNVFSAGGVRSGIDVADARVEQALAAYEHTVLAALEDVEGTLIRYHHERQRNASLLTAVHAYRQAVEFAEQIYKGGKSDFQGVLDAQRNLLAFEDQLAVSHAALVENVVALYRALGGGWIGDSTKNMDSAQSDGDQEGEQS